MPGPAAGSNIRVLRARRHPNHCTRALAGRPRRTASQFQQLALMRSLKRTTPYCTISSAQCLTTIAVISVRSAVVASSGHMNAPNTHTLPNAFGRKLPRGKENPNTSNSAMGRPATQFANIEQQQVGLVHVKVVRFYYLTGASGSVVCASNSDDHITMATELTKSTNTHTNKTTET